MKIVCDVCTARWIGIYDTVTRCRYTTSIRGLVEVSTRTARQNGTISRFKRTLHPDFVLIFFPPYHLIVYLIKHMQLNRQLKIKQVFAK